MPRELTAAAERRDGGRNNDFCKKIRGKKTPAVFKSFEKGIQSRAVHARLRGAVLHGGGDNAAYGIFLYGHWQKLPDVARFRSERFRAGDFAHGAFRSAY